MPFPKNNIKIIRGGATSPREKDLQDETTGIITTKIKPCNEKLPNAELFKIENQIKAGITLNEVNTTVITNDVPAMIAENVEKIITKPSKKSTKTTKSTKSDEVE